MSVRERLRQLIGALAWVSLIVGALLFLSILPVSIGLITGQPSVMEIYNALWRFLAGVSCLAFGLKFGP